MKAVVLALHTTSIVEARQRRIEVAYRVERMFRDARAKLPKSVDQQADPEEPPDPDDLALHMVDYYETELAIWSARAKRPLIAKGTPFSRVAADYLREMQRDPGTALSETTVRQREGIFRLFADFIDDCPLPGVDRKTASSFLSTVAKLHPDWGRHSDSKDLPFGELLTKYGRGERQLSNAAVNVYHSALKSVFDHALRTGDLEEWFSNPFSGLSRRVADAKWQPYAPSELKSLLENSEGPLWWYIMVAMYSGMRLGEIATARIERGPEGIHYFDVRKAKTAAGVRQVPVHSALITARDGIRGSNYQTMTAANVTKHFGRLRTKTGLTRPRLSFHSLRKNAVTALDQAGVNTTDIAMLVGHSRSFSLDRYSKGPGLKRLQEIVEKIQYSL
jgi:integrase